MIAFIEGMIENRRCGTRGNSQLRADVRDVSVNGVLAEHEARGDLLVAQSLGHEPKHLGGTDLAEDVTCGAALVRGSLLATDRGERGREAETGTPRFKRGSASVEEIDGILGDP